MDQYTAECSGGEIKNRLLQLQIFPLVYAEKDQEYRCNGKNSNAAALIAFGFRFLRGDEQSQSNASADPRENDKKPPPTFGEIE